MSRIRSIKPDFWASEQIMALPRDARLLFIGIWNFADDAGRFKWSPGTLRAQIFPGDLDVTVPMVEQWLALLVHGGLVERYLTVHGPFHECSRTTHGRVTGWHHQRINRPQPSKLPDPKGCLVVPCACSECSVNAHGALTDNSLTDPLGSSPPGREGSPHAHESVTREGAHPSARAREAPAAPAAGAASPSPIPSRGNETERALGKAIKRLATSFGHEAPPTATRAHKLLAAEKVAALVASGVELDPAAERVVTAAYELFATGKPSSFSFALSDCTIGAHVNGTPRREPQRMESIDEHGRTKHAW